MNRKISKAFTMIELVFVIVIMGIIGKFGTEFLAQAYNSFIHTKINNELQANSTSAVEFISTRLQHRIKDSVIARESNNSFYGLSGSSTGTAPILEWVATDIDGFRGDSLPYWSGIIELGYESNATYLESPETNTTEINSSIDILSNGNSSINDAALYFIDSSNDIQTGYGWNGVKFTDQNHTMHPIKSVSGEETKFISSITGVDFTNVDVSEYYKLSWTAYAVGFDNYNDTTKSGTLSFWYDYQPWNGQNYKDDGKKVTIMENVSTFQFMAIGSLIKIQVCSNSDLLTNEEYSICKEKTIY